MVIWGRAFCRVLLILNIPHKEVRGILESPVLPSVDAWLGKMVQGHNCFPFTQVYHHETSHRLLTNEGCTPKWFSGHKVKVTMHWYKKKIASLGKVFKHITVFPVHLSLWNFTQRLPISQGCALLILGLKIKGHGHNALMTENGLCCIIAFLLHP